MWNVPSFLWALVFISHPHPSGMAHLPILPVGWSLNYEVFFYVLVALAIGLFKARWLPAVAVVLLALPWVWQEGWPYAEVLRNPLLWLFVGGMLLNWVAGWHMKHRWVALGLMLGVLVVTIHVLAGAAVPSKAMKMGLAFALVWAVVLLQCARWPGARAWPVLTRLGDWSYSTYLVHLIIVFLLANPKWMPVLAEYKGLVFLVYLALVLLASFYYHRYVESMLVKKRLLPG